MTASLLEQLADLPKAEVDALIRAMAPGEANAFEYDWRYRARPEQLPPAGSWRVWLLPVVCSGYRGHAIHLGAGAAMVQPCLFSAANIWNHSVEPGWGTV